MRYEILEGLPPYGPMYVTIPEGGYTAYSEGYVIRLYKSDGTDWVANFARGWTQLKGVFEIDQQTKLLVIAYGTCYIIDPEKPKPLSSFGCGYSSMLLASDDRYVLADDTDLTIIEPDGSYWHTENISLDGIKELAMDKGVVSGLALPFDGTDSWDAFSYDIDKKALQFDKKELRVAKTDDPVKKAFWKFWQ